MRLTLRITMDGEAFGADEDSRAHELNRLLAYLQARFANDGVKPGIGVLFDANGNQCGKWAVQ